MESNIAPITQNNHLKNHNNELKGHDINPKYHFINALRPFSLPVAIVTCSLGIAAGQNIQAIDLSTAFLVLLAGVFLQAAVNLINDHADIKNPTTQPQLSPSDVMQITLNYKVGWLCFVFCAAIGTYLTYKTSLFLLMLAVLGGLGALFYTTEPIHYKRRGLGVVLVFFLMGVLMVYGASYAVTGQHNIEAIIISIPVSFLTSALLLSNELRDYSNDKKEGLKTLTVRLGLNTGKKLYLVTILFAFISIALIASFRQSWVAGVIFIPALILAIFAIQAVTTKTDLKGLPPMTGRLYLVFGIGEIILLLT